MNNFLSTLLLITLCVCMFAPSVAVTYNDVLSLDSEKPVYLPNHKDVTVLSFNLASAANLTAAVFPCRGAMNWTLTRVSDGLIVHEFSQPIDTHDHVDGDDHDHDHDDHDDDHDDHDHDEEDHDEEDHDEEDHDEEDHDEEDHDDHDDHDDLETVSIVELNSTIITAGDYRLEIVNAEDTTALARVFVAAASEFPYPSLPEEEEITFLLANFTEETTDLLVSWEPLQVASASYCVYVHQESFHSAHHVHNSFCAVNNGEAGTTAYCGITDTHFLVPGLTSHSEYHVDVVGTNVDTQFSTSYVGGEVSTHEEDSHEDEHTEAEADDNIAVVIAGVLGAIVIVAIVFLLMRSRKERHNFDNEGTTLDKSSSVNV